MGEATGVLTVVRPGQVETYSWNGVAEDRAAAREVFEERMKSGSWLATVTDSPGKAHQIRSFEEIEQIEKERGLVEAKITPALVGG